MAHPLEGHRVAQDPDTEHEECPAIGLAQMRHLSQVVHGQGVGKKKRSSKGDI